MDNEKVRKDLLKIKVQVSQLMVKVLESKIGIADGDDSELVKPFVNIENAIEEELHKLKLQSNGETKNIKVFGSSQLKKRLTE